MPLRIAMVPCLKANPLIAVINAEFRVLERYFVGSNMYDIEGDWVQMATQCNEGIGCRLEERRIGSTLAQGDGRMTLCGAFFMRVPDTFIPSYIHGLQESFQAGVGIEP